MLEVAAGRPSTSCSANCLLSASECNPNGSDLFGMNFVEASRWPLLTSGHRDPSIQI